MGAADNERLLRRLL